MQNSLIRARRDSLFSIHVHEIVRLFFLAEWMGVELDQTSPYASNPAPGPRPPAPGLSP